MESKEVHYRYAISYLLLAIILIIALAYYDVPNLVDKFSFALTLSSLLLAVLAIFYTVVSAHKQDSQFAKILEATSKLGVSVKDIDEAAKSISRLTKDIPEHFESINSKIDGIQFSYRAISDIEKVSEIPIGDDPNLERSNLRNTIQKLHFNGMAILYWFTVASIKNKAIDYSEFEDFQMANIDYAIGFLNAFTATGLIDFKLHKGSIVPVECSDILYRHLNGLLSTLVTVINKKSAENLSEAIEWIDRKYA